MTLLPLMRGDLEGLPKVLTEPFDRRQEFHDEQLGVHLMASVHPVVILEHVLGREADVRALEEALTRPTGPLAPAFIHRHSDLYDFWQTGDLGSRGMTTAVPMAIDSLLGRLRDELLRRVRPVVERIIGRPLDANVLDYSAQCYGKHQYLLTHDDRLDSRRVAFVLYLVPSDWEGQVDGGQLDFFPTDWRGAPIISADLGEGGGGGGERGGGGEAGESTNDTSREGQDSSIVIEGGGETKKGRAGEISLTHALTHTHTHQANTCQRYVPRRNCLAFFEVTMCSQHQVAEVLSDRSRLSISGWFHDDPTRKDNIPGAVRDDRPPAIINAQHVVRWHSPRLGHVERALSEAFHLQLTAYEAFREADARRLWTPEAIFTHYVESRETAWQKALMSRHLRFWLESLLRQAPGTEFGHCRLDWQTRPVLRKYLWRQRSGAGAGARGQFEGGESPQRSPRQGKGCPSTRSRDNTDECVGGKGGQGLDADTGNGTGTEVRIEEEPRNRLTPSSDSSGHPTSPVAPPPSELHVTIYLHGTRDNVMRLALLGTSGSSQEGGPPHHDDDDDNNNNNNEEGEGEDKEMMANVLDPPQSVIEMRFACVRF